MDHLAHLQMLRAIMLDELVGRETSDILVQPQVRFVDLRIRWSGVSFEHFGRKQLMVPGEPDQIVVAGDDP